MADVRAYRVLLTPEDEGGFSVSVPAFPAIHTQGDDLADALAMAQDAIALELDYARQKGLQPPAPDADGSVLLETVVVPIAAA
jgi:predicted RNase H-like HicB family nuclease